MLAQYDANKDGFLDKEELKKCPALASCVKALDKDKDGRLSSGEIAERIKSYEANRVGLTALTVKVTLDRKPLAGATVTLTPEKFLGDALKPATGTTNTGGIVNVATAGTEVPGVASGMFRVEVSKKDGTGRETLPNRYNQATILGVEVGPDSQGVLRLALTRLVGGSFTIFVSSCHIRLGGQQYAESFVTERKRARGLHADRIACRHRHNRGLDCLAIAGRAGGPRVGQPHPVRQ